MVKYAVGTLFLKSFLGYGVWRGHITKADDDHYTVLYPDDGFEEEFSCSEMDMVMARSKRLIEKKVRVATKENDMILPEEDFADRKSPPEALVEVHQKSSNSTALFYEGQRVWVVVGKERQAAVIRTIIATDSADTELPPKQASVKWTMAPKTEVVELDSLLPMSDDEKKGSGKRNRKQTDKYIPPMNKAIKEEQSDFAVGASNHCSKYEQDGECEHGVHEDDPSLIHLDPCQFEEGQHVWVSSGKCKHPAVVQSIDSNIAYVRWSATETLGKIAVKKLLPMFEEDNGESIPSSFSKRKRKETVRYTPPQHLHTKRVKAEDPPEVNAPSITTMSHPKAQLVTQKKQESRETTNQRSTSMEADAANIQNNLDTLAKVPPGVAPGPGWTSKWDACRRRWVSPQKKIVFKTPRCAFQFEPFRLKCGGNEYQAYEMYRDHKCAAGESLNIYAKGLLDAKVLRRKCDDEEESHSESEEEESEEEESKEESEEEEEESEEASSSEERATWATSAFIQNNLDTLARVPPGVAPGPGWTLKWDVYHSGRLRRWISPQKKIIFKTPRCAFQFEACRLKCGGNECKAYEMYRDHKISAGKSLGILNKGRLDVEVFSTKKDFCRENRNPIAKKGSCPGPGWTSKLRSNGKTLARSWISPQQEISFATRKAAVEFEAFRLKCNGDECEAFKMYWDHHKATGRKNLNVNNHGKLRQGIGTRVSLQSILAKKSATHEIRSSLPVRVKKTVTKSVVDKKPADPFENMTLTEIAEYKALYDYYLKPSTRENEEIPASGMVLRTKRASCNLLRFKNSIFRSKLHRELLRLEKQGRKDKILRMLRSMNEHDKGMKSGDGPSELVDEILGKQNTDDDIEILSSADIAALQPRACPLTLDISENNTVTDLADSRLDSKLSVKTDSNTKEKKSSESGSDPGTDSKLFVKIDSDKEGMKALSTPSKPTALSGSESPTDVKDLKMIDLCNDDGLGETYAQSGVGQQQAVQNVLREWLSEEPGEATSVVAQTQNNDKARSTEIISVDDSSEGAKTSKQNIAKNGLLDEAQKRRTKGEFVNLTSAAELIEASTALTTKSNHNKFPEQDSETKPTSTRETEVIDLSQDDQLPTPKSNEVIVID